MPSIPLALRLRRSIHRETALAQDLMVVGVIEVLPGSILHGGTAIWRCYGGNRFSEDVDFYFPGSARRNLAKLAENLKRKGLETQGIRETANAVFAKFGEGVRSVRLEATFRTSVSVVRPFEMIDGTFVTIRTLRPEGLLMEKISAYRERRKVRDLYDVYFLTRLVEPIGGIRARTRQLLERFERPADEGELKAIIISGVAPRVGEMIEAIQRWAR